MLEAERLGFDTVFTAESWGSDAFTPSGVARLADLDDPARHVDRADLGPHADVGGDARADARPPLAAVASCSASACPGPQVVEGWYGQPFGKPLARTREYVDIVRQVLAREGPVTNDGPHYPLPYDGPTARSGWASRSSRSCTRCAPTCRSCSAPRARRTWRMTAEIADGWLPIYYSPKVADDVQRVARRGLRPAGARGDAATFEIATNCSVVVTDDVEGTLDAMKPTLGFYIGGMGAKDMNFHKQVFARMGYEAEADEIQDLFFAGERDKAIAAVPAQMAADISLVGPAGQDPRRPRHVGGGRRHDARHRRPRRGRDAPGRRSDPRLTTGR